MISFKNRLKFPEWIKNIAEFIWFIIEYGILLSLVAYGVFRFEIDIWRFIGLGVGFYLLVFEVRRVFEHWKYGGNE